MEKLLIFHLSGTEAKKLKQVTGNLKIRCEFIEPIHYRQTLETLLNGAPPVPSEPFTGEAPNESLLLMCDFTEKRMDKFLFSLRRYQVQADYKAVLTPTNRKWTVLRLMLEMQAEKAAFQTSNP